MIERRKTERERVFERGTKQEERGMRGGEKRRKGEKKRYRWTESLKDRNDRTEVEVDGGRE